MSLNPYAIVVHTFGCPAYHKEGECRCFMVQCARCKYPGDRLHFCYCLEAEMAEDVKWREWEEFKRRENFNYRQANPTLYGDVVASPDEDREFEWWQSREREREQQRTDESRWGK
jgi:hypothetical protein